VQGGAADVLVLDWPAIARLQTSGVKLIAIAPFLTYVNSVMTPAKSTLHDLPDLVGKKIGVFSRTSMDWIIMEAAAQKLYGIDLEKTVQLQEGSPGLLRGASEQGQLDATQMYNSLAPEMLASGRFKTLFTIRSLTERLGFPDEPYLFYAMNTDYAAKHPDNARAFVAAYRDVVQILKTDDSVWLEQGGNLGLSEGAITFFRDEVRADIVTAITPQTEATLDATFDILLKTAGPDVLGMSKMPEHVVTLQYQP
jgi:ABC-type nitrate/sulfonate/bicarbonate transport system substrate-binding protein